MREHEAIPDFHKNQFSKPDQESNIWTFLTQRSPQPSEGEIHVKKEENKQISCNIIMAIQPLLIMCGGNEEEK